jgi:hypothetical protein
MLQSVCSGNDAVAFSETIMRTVRPGLPSGGEQDEGRKERAAMKQHKSRTTKGRREEMRGKRGLRDGEIREYYEEEEEDREKMSSG